MPVERRKIVLVDDSPTILRLARNTLMGEYDVFTAPCAEKLFLLLEKTLPDLILLDVVMPETDGYEAIRILKRDRRTADIPVIFLTSRADAASELEGLSLGAVDYIVKPFAPQLLLKRVELHTLLEAQKRELRHLNGDLQSLVEKKTASVTELQNALLKTMAHLVEWRDDATGGHVERTRDYMHMLVSKMRASDLCTEQLDSWHMELLYQSALLHDVGKIAIRDSILLKPGKLTDEEFEEMKKHTIYGEMIIEGIQRDTSENMFLTHAGIMAGTHHENWDGSGYPRGLSGEDIPLQGRMMALVDVYDALVSARPYKKPISGREALQIMEDGAGSKFDPLLTGAFLNALGASPGYGVLESGTIR
ncbi:MAG: response regulator [Synergistaceae bacterium]|nr:response regulator [Synergistaceae bacterium]